MNSMAAVEHRCRSHRVKKEFKTDWAILLHAVLNTDVIVLQAHISLQKLLLLLRDEQVETTVTALLLAMTCSTPVCQNISGVTGATFSDVE